MRKTTYMYKTIICLLFMAIAATAYSQDKKVAVVTFYADKRVGMEELHLETTADFFKLEEDPNFNMAPLLANFHAQFFDNYAKSFPFQLVPEPEVFNNPGYKTFIPEGRPPAANDRLFTIIDGYKLVDYQWGNANETNLLDIFNQYDGIMFVFLSFSFQPGFMIQGAGTMKMRAYAHIIVLNRNGGTVFNIRESATSKKTVAVVGGLPIMKVEKILPMCESALEELMPELQKRIPKIIKKSEEKL